jgi:ABC-type multidrug transport system fused ATPase/permease subunit
MARACRDRRPGLLAGVLVGLGWTAGKVSVGLLVQKAVDQGIEGDDMAALRHWALLIALAALVVGTFTGIRRYLAFREARWIEADLRERLFAHFQKLHFGFHDTTQTGELMSRANTDLQQIQAFVVMIPLTISNFVTVLAVTVILLTIDPVLTLLALGTLPFLNVLATRFSRRLHPAVMGIQRESAELAAVVEETVAGVRVIKGFGAEAVQGGRLQVEADDIYRESIRAARVRARYAPALDLLPNIGLIATLGYGPDLPLVLDDLDLAVPAGQSVALVGATGSGKTTVARLLPRFYDVDAGAVVLDGVDVRHLRLRELRKAIGIVFEETFLFSDTIGANIAFADPDASPRTVERAARLAGAHEFITALPEGYGTTIGERGSSLSGGQRQRIAIARAILADPRVLILDDATASVDPPKEHEIRDALAEVMLGRTTLVIAHRPATIALADRVVLLADGRVAADGTHEDLLRTSAAYREVLAAAERREAEARAASEPEGVH